MSNIRSLFPLAALLLTLLPQAARNQQKDTPMTAPSPASAAGIATLMPRYADHCKLWLPADAPVDSLTVDRAAHQAVPQGARKMGCVLPLPEGRAVTVTAQFHFTGNV